MKMKPDQATRIKTFANDIGAKYNLYRPLVEDILYDYVREAMPKKLRQFFDENFTTDDSLVYTPDSNLFVKADDYLNQLDIYIEKAENRLCKDISKYLKFKNLEVKPEGLITPEEFKMHMQDIADRLERNMDEERMHKEADKYMLNLLCSLGYKDGCDIFIDMPKWYA